MSTETSLFARGKHQAKRGQLGKNNRTLQLSRAFPTGGAACRPPPASPPAPSLSSPSSCRSTAVSVGSDCIGLCTPYIRSRYRHIIPAPSRLPPSPPTPSQSSPSVVSVAVGAASQREPAWYSQGVKAATHPPIQIRDVEGYRAHAAKTHIAQQMRNR